MRDKWITLIDQRTICFLFDCCQIWLLVWIAFDCYSSFCDPCFVYPPPRDDDDDDDDLNTKSKVRWDEMRKKRERDGEYEDK